MSGSNPRDLTLWVLQLLRYDIVSVDIFLDAWAYEANRIFRDRLVGPESQDQFDSVLRWDNTGQHCSKN